MGRGRAKAKQTKVARQLKYTTTGTDLDRLQAELAGPSDRIGLGAPEAVDDHDDDDTDDPYAAYADDGDEDEDD
jgi:DUF3073 family protein